MRLRNLINSRKIGKTYLIYNFKYGKQLIYFYIHFFRFVSFEENVVQNGEKDCESENAKKSLCTTLFMKAYVIVKMGKKQIKKKISFRPKVQDRVSLQ